MILYIVKALRLYRILEQISARLTRRIKVRYFKVKYVVFRELHSGQEKIGTRYEGKARKGKGRIESLPYLTLLIT